MHSLYLFLHGILSIGIIIFNVLFMTRSPQICELDKNAVCGALTLLYVICLVGIIMLPLYHKLFVEETESEQMSNT